MNTCVIRSWWILLSIIAASALATPYGRFVENFDEDQNERGLFREEAFVLNKRDKPTPNSVARLARMHSTVGIGKRNQQDSFFERMSKKRETSPGQGAWNTASGKTTNPEVNIANIDKFAKGFSDLSACTPVCGRKPGYLGCKPVEGSSKYVPKRCCAGKTNEERSMNQTACV